LALIELQRGALWCFGYHFEPCSPSIGTLLHRKTLFNVLKGVEVLLGNEEVQTAFFSLALKTDATLKQKFLFAYSQVFSEEIDKKLSAYMKKAFAFIGYIEPVLQTKQEISEIPTNSFDLSFKWLLKLLHVPFVDIEHEGLLVLRSKFLFYMGVFVNFVG